MTFPFPSNEAAAKAQAAHCAQQDHKNGRPCDPTRHGALDNSAWAGWYRAAFPTTGAKQ